MPYSEELALVGQVLEEMWKEQTAIVRSMTTPMGRSMAGSEARSLVMVAIALNAKTGGEFAQYVPYFESRGLL